MTDKKDMSGILFVNDKGDNPKRPDYRGDITIDGVTYKLSGWRRRAKNGATFLSLAVQAGEQSQGPASEEGSPF